MKDSPNLNAMRVFECAARHSSFSRAAEELNVTQSAVSKQVASLENYFDVPLFERRHRAIILTPLGERVAKAARVGIHQITDRLRAIDRAPPQQIRIFGDADFIHLWLFPKLQEFEKLHPNLRISIQTNVAMRQPPDCDYDCAFIWGRGGWADSHYQALLTNSVFPVASPGYFRHLDRNPTPKDINGGMLIHDQSRFWWSEFCAAVGAVDLNPEEGRIYGQTSLCLEAAARMDGITMGDEVTTKYHLEAGRLICPFDVKLPSSNAFYVTMPFGVAPSEELQLFLDWVFAQAAEHVEWYANFWRSLEGWHEPPTGR
ncbi:MAG: hypothetical protein CML51_05380 [Rhodobacteraceae bacterium]|nr:hypothetical protein [Paracoccaceae bacterium]